MAYIDLAFHISGSWIPADHAYLLYAGLCSRIPALHGEIAAPRAVRPPVAPEPLWRVAAIHPIRGKLIGDRRLQLTENSRVTIRLPVTRIDEVLGIVSKHLQVGPQKLALGTPEILPLRPSASLYSRLVTIKGQLNPEEFLLQASSDLTRMGVKATASIPLRKEENSVEDTRTAGKRTPFLRRTLQIQDKQIVGFAVSVSGLSAEESIVLQEQGLGGRRRFGCGVFIPAR